MKNSQEQKDKNSFLKVLKNIGKGSLYIGGGILGLALTVLRFLYIAAAGFSAIYAAIHLFILGSIFWGIVVLLLGTVAAISIANFLFIPSLVFSLAVLVIFVLGKIFHLGFTTDAISHYIWVAILILIVGYFLYLIISGAYGFIVNKNKPIEGKGSEDAPADFSVDKNKNDWNEFLSVTLDEDSNAGDIAHMVNNFFIPDHISIDKFIANYQVIQYGIEEAWELKYGDNADHRNMRTSSIEAFSDIFERPLGYYWWFIAAYPDVVNWAKDLEDDYLAVILDNPNEDDLFNDDEKFKFKYLRKMVEIFKFNGNKIETSL